jgi:hypothetical protein
MKCDARDERNVINKVHQVVVVVVLSLLSLSLIHAHRYLLLPFIMHLPSLLLAIAVLLIVIVPHISADADHHHDAEEFDPFGKVIAELPNQGLCNPLDCIIHPSSSTIVLTHPPWRCNV